MLLCLNTKSTCSGSGCNVVLLSRCTDIHVSDKCGNLVFMEDITYKVSLELTANKQ